MDISKLSETEIKATCYDQLALIEQAQANLRALNAELVKRQEKPKEEEKKA